MTERMLNNTNWDKVQNDNGFIKRMRLIICKQRMMRECQVSFLDSETPLIPIVTDDNMMKHWPDCLKIVNIASKDVYLCVKYGYDRDQLSIITKWLSNELPSELPIDLTRIIIHYYMGLEIKSYIGTNEIYGVSCINVIIII